MPIVGLGERKRYTRIGIFRKGEKTEKGTPKGLDYFIIDSDLAEGVKAIYGNEPSQVLVYLADNLGSHDWDASYKRYGKNGLSCRGDGETGHEIQQNGVIKERPCANLGCPFAEPTEKNNKSQPAACGPKGLLNFMVVGLPTAGTFQLGINGMSACDRTESYLQNLKRLAGGDLTGVPFLVTIQLKTNRQGYPLTIVGVKDAPETSQALKDRTKRHTANLSLETATGYAITNDEGELLATPEISNSETLPELEAFAKLLDWSLKTLTLGPDQRSGLESQLQGLGKLTVDDARTKYGQLFDWITRNFPGTLASPQPAPTQLVEADNPPRVDEALYITKEQRARLLSAFEGLGEKKKKSEERNTSSEEVRYWVYGAITDHGEPLHSLNIKVEEFEYIRGMVDDFTAWCKKNNLTLTTVEEAQRNFEAWNASGDLEEAA